MQIAIAAIVMPQMSVFVVLDMTLCYSKLINMDKTLRR